MSQTIGKQGLNRVYDHKGLISRWWQSRSYLQQRMLRMCTSMLVMIICFPLYYMGLFGSVDGPLNPDRIGAKLAGLGVTDTHILLVFLSLVIISISWNWIFNGISLMVGARLSCDKTDGNGHWCGQPSKRIKKSGKGFAKDRHVYICNHGHKRNTANFHPVSKGTFSRTLLAISIICSLIIYFSG